MSKDQADFDRGADLEIPIDALTPLALARNRPDRERAVLKDLRLPDDLIGREFRLTVQYRPTADQESSVLFLGGTVSGFALLDDAFRLYISTPSIAGRRVEGLDARPAEWVGDNDEWRLVLEAPHGVHPTVSRIELRFPCHLELLEPRKPKQD